MSVAAAAAHELIETHGLRSALELGPHHAPRCRGQCHKDYLELPDLEVPAKVIMHDARRTPWPMEDDAYDLFVGLQVFEHLVDSQNAAFQEVHRIAKHTVISLPIDWVMKDPTNTHHQISNERALTWFEPVECEAPIEVGNAGPGKRLVSSREPQPVSPDAACRTRSAQAFFQTETCLVLSSVSSERSQSAHRCASSARRCAPSDPSRPARRSGTGCCGTAPYRPRTPSRGSR